MATAFFNQSLFASFFVTLPLCIPDKVDALPYVIFEVTSSCGRSEGAKITVPLSFTIRFLLAILVCSEDGGAFVTGGLGGRLCCLTENGLFQTLIDH